MRRAVELLVASAAVLLLAGACGGASDDVVFASPPGVPDQPAPTFAPTTTPAPTFAPTTTTRAPEETPAPEVVEPVENVRVEGAPAPTPVPTTGGVHDLIASLPVAPESAAGPYSRHLFGGSWIDADGDGCDTRCEVLRSDRHPSLPGLPAGGWLSTYDGYTTDDPSELDIDHLVPLAEAWRSGASGWDGPRRLAFANDLDHPGALVAVTAASNRSKGDKDPAAWQPPSTSAWCDYVMAWVTTKLRWELTADEAEVRALTNMARSQSC